MIRLLISEPSIILKSKLNEYTNEVITERDDFNYITFDFEETPLEEIISCLQSPSFSSAKKVVICKNPYFIKDEKTKLPFENDLALLKEYLENENPDTEFIIICNQKYYNEKSKYLPLFEKNGCVEDLSFSDEYELRQYGTQLIKRVKLDIDDDAANILFTRCMNDVCKLEREIAKLSLYGEHIDKEIVCKMVSKPLEDDIFALSNALLAKDRKKIMKIYTDLKLLKVEPVSLISLLSNQFRVILQTLVLKGKYKSEEEIASLLSIHPYRVKVALKHSKNYNLDAVKQILVDLATLDSDIKLGKIDRYVNLELFLSTK